MHQLQLQCSPLTKKLNVYLNAYTIGLPDFSCFKIFIFHVLNQSCLLLSKNEIHQLLPYIFKRQP